MRRGPWRLGGFLAAASGERGRGPGGARGGGRGLHAVAGRRGLVRVRGAERGGLGRGGRLRWR